jgi:formyltetrahydrofolate-dependent phosphoribosylglycinamide formyltransferase
MSTRVAVCVSGRGSNLRALLEALPDGAPAEVALVLSNRRDAGGLAIAREFRVETAVLEQPDDAGEWLARLGAARIDLVVLAGFLKRVPPAVVAAFPHRMINIHPALLPDHGGPGMYGLAVHRAVLARGDRESGATVHEVTERYDEGPVLGQIRVPVLPDDTPERLAERVLAAEHRLLPAAVLAAARAGRAVRFPAPAGPATSVA